MQKKDTLISKASTLLIVDDDYTTRLLVRELVRKFGFRVLGTNNGFEGIELLQQHSKELFLVLLDLRLPQISGWDLVTEMRKINADIPIIAISALPPAEIRQSYRLYGFTDFIEKPMHIDEFGAKVFKYHFMKSMRIN